MNKSLVFKNKFYLFISFIFTFFLFMYLMFFLVNGPGSIVNYFKLINLNNKYSKQLNHLNLQNEILIDRINRLQPQTLDLDYLEEKLRKNTGFSKNNEIIVIIE